MSTPLEPTPVRRAGCGARVTDRLGNLVAFRIHVVGQEHVEGVEHEPPTGMPESRVTAGTGDGG